MTDNLMQLAVDLAYQRAANKPLTHTQDWDPQGTGMFASCGARVQVDQIVMNGVKPTCPTCAQMLTEDNELLDAFNEAEGL